MSSASTRTRRLIGLALAGAAMMTVAPAAQAATYVYSSGFYNPGVTSPNPLGAGDLLQIVGGGFKYFDNVAFTNNGQVDWSDTFYMQSGASITNNGLFNALGDHAIIYNGGSTTVFNNTGTFRKSGGAGATTIGGIAFVNSGVIDAQTGSIAFNGGNATFNAGSSFIGAGTVDINSNATFNGSFTSSNLRINGGIVTGGSAVMNGLTTFTGGNIQGNWQVASGQTFQGVDGGFKYLDGAALTNNGTINWNTGNALYFQNGAVLTNAGLFATNADTAFIYNGGANPNFVNTGTLRATSGTTLNIQSRLENNGGTIEANGTIRFINSNATFNNGTIFNGTGVSRVESDSAFNGTYNSSNLEIAGGRVTGGSAVATGNTSFTGGRFSGTWEIASGGQITGNNGGFKYIDGATLVNNGTWLWQTGDGLYFENNAELRNNALMDYTASATMFYNGGTTSTLRNSASGTIRVAAGQTLGINTLLVSDGGTLTSNGITNLNNSNAVINAGTLFNGAGVTNVASTTTFNGAFTSSNLVFTGGAFIGNAAQLNGIATFTGGTFTGNWEIASGQTLVGSAGGFKYIDNGVVTNNGVINWNTGDGLFLQSGGELTNNAALNINESSGIFYNGGAATTLRNTATGTITVASGKTYAITNRLISDGGTITSNGTANLNGSNAVINAGSVFNGSGTTQVTSSATFNGGFTSSNLVFAGGVFGGNAAVVGGTASFTGGTFAGTWSVGAGQTLVGNDGGFKYLDSVTFTNNGTIDWNSGNALYLQSSAVLNNAGVYDMGADTGIYYNGGSAVAINNSGTIVKSAGTGTAVIGDGTNLVNTGTLDVQTGRLRLPSNFTNNGTMTGIGAFEVNGTLTNAGTIAPGNGAGTLNLFGNYTQTAAGTFAAQLQSSALADLFLVNGNAALGGTLALSCIGGCNIATGDVFTIFDSTGPLSGTFANVTTSGFLQGFQYDVVYDYTQNFVQLRVLDRGVVVNPGVPEPATWAMMIAGFAMAGGAIRRRRPTLQRVAA